MLVTVVFEREIDALGSLNGSRGWLLIGKLLFYLNLLPSSSYYPWISSDSMRSYT